MEEEKEEREFQKKIRNEEGVWNKLAFILNMVSGKCDKRHPTECYYFRKYGKGVNLAHSNNKNRVTSNQRKKTGKISYWVYKLN